MTWDVIKLIGDILLMSFLTIWIVLFLAINDTANLFKVLGILGIAVLFIWFIVRTTKEHIEDIINNNK